MKIALVGTACWLGFLAGLTAVSEAGESLPNVLFLVSDDMLPKLGTPVLAECLHPSVSILEQ